jgi:hypothetical protein
MKKYTPVRAIFRRKSKNGWNTSTILAAIVFVITVAGLIIYYRQGGIKDFGIRETGLRDVGVYIDGGTRILNQTNPYIFGLRGGTFGSLVIAILFKWIPLSLSTIYFQILSFIGIAIFIKSTQIRFSIGKFLIILSSVYVFSSTRELLATNQIVAICMGFLGGGLILLKSKNIIVRIAGIALVAASVDLKPHLFGLFIVVLFLNSRKYRDLYILFLFLLLTHLLIDLSQKRILEIDWIKMISGFQGRAQNAGLGDSVTFWPILSKILGISNYPGFVLLIPFALLAVISFYLLHTKHANESIMVSLFAPAFLFYFHFYDAMPFLILVFIFTLKSQLYFQNIIAVMFWNMSLLAKEINNSRNIVFLIVYLAILLIAFYGFRKLHAFIVATIITVMIRICLINWIDSSALLQSAVVTVNIVLGIIFILFLKSKTVPFREPKTL